VLAVNGGEDVPMFRVPVTVVKDVISVVRNGLDGYEMPA
jgi:hypothetical protein